MFCGFFADVSECVNIMILPSILSKSLKYAEQLNSNEIEARIGEG